jgi:hypothetical protein
MKTKILKAILYLVGWILSIINIGPLGLRLMNQPSNLYLILGILLTIALISIAFTCSWRFGQTIAQIILEYKTKKENK